MERVVRLRGALLLSLSLTSMLQAEDDATPITALQVAVQRQVAELTLEPDRMASSLGLTLTVTPLRPEVGVVEPIAIELTIANESKHARAWRDAGGQSTMHFRFAVFDERGNPVPLTVAGKRQAEIPGINGSRWVEALAPKGTWNSRFLVNETFDMTREGKYTILVWRPVRMKPHPFKGEGQDYAHKEYRLIANPVTVTVDRRHAVPEFWPASNAKPESQPKTKKPSTQRGK